MKMNDIDHLAAMMANIPPKLMENIMRSLENTVDPLSSLEHMPSYMARDKLSKLLAISLRTSNWIDPLGRVCEVIQVFPQSTETGEYTILVEYVEHDTGVLETAPITTFLNEYKRK